MLQSTDPSCSALDPFNYSFPLEAGRLPSQLPGISPAPSPSLGANARSLELLGSSKTGFASGMTLSNQLIVKSNTHTYSYYVFYMHAICTEIIYFSSVTISFLLLALFFFLPFLWGAVEDNSSFYWIHTHRLWLSAVIAGKVGISSASLQAKQQSLLLKRGFKAPSASLWWFLERITSNLRFHLRLRELRRANSFQHSGHHSHDVNIIKGRHTATLLGETQACSV